jgi:C1A family cysteine protease
MGNKSSRNESNGQVTEYWIKDDVVSGHSLPDEVDLRRTSCFPYPTLKDQGTEGTCVAHAINIAYICAQRKHDVSVVNTNVHTAEDLFEQARDKSKISRPQSKGITFSEAMKSLGTQATWFRLGKTTNNFRKCLVLGYPIVFGFGMTNEMYDWQLNKNDGMKKSNYVMPTPTSPELTEITAFHCVMIVGYKNGLFICRNSWGDTWGKEGHFYLPFEVMNNHKIVVDSMVIDVIKK